MRGTTLPAPAVAALLALGCCCGGLRERDGEDAGGGGDAGVGDTAEVDPCEDRVCQAPPAPACVDASTLRVHAPFGRCVPGPDPAATTCDYELQDIACEHECAADRCVCPVPAVDCAVEDLAVGQASVRRIAVDGTHVYWVDLDLSGDGGRVLRRALAGGPVQTLAAGQDRPANLAIDATDVYWTTNFGGQVARVDKEGGDVELVAEGQPAPFGIAVDGTHVYWTAGRGLYRRAKSGGEIVELATVGELASNLALDATRVYFVGLSTSAGRSRLLRVAKDGGPVETLAADLAAPGDVVVTATHLYWTSAPGGHVMRWPTRGGAVEEVASAQGDPSNVAVDETHVYWTDQLADQLLRRAIGGGPVETLASGQDSARYVVAGPTHVYWGTHHEVRRVSRCACDL